jgi:hypothetical protein
MRKVDGWPTLATNPVDQPIDLAALGTLKMQERVTPNSNTSGDAPSKVRKGTRRATSSTTRRSRPLCRTRDEADAEDEHADGQQYCADIGEVDEPVRGRGIGRQHG